MRRLKIVGAAIIAIIALSAVAAATASAAEPELLPGKAGEKYTASSGAGTLSTVKEPSIECKSDTASGEIKGTKTASVTIDFTGCKALKLVGAHSLGDAEGTILTGGEESLCLIKAKEVGGVIKIAPLHIEVAGKLIEVTGSVIGEALPLEGKASKSGELALEEKSKGVQKLLKCEGGAETHLSASINEGTAESSAETTTDKISYETAQTLME